MGRSCAIGSVVESDVQSKHSALQSWPILLYIRYGVPIYSLTRCNNRDGKLLSLWSSPLELHTGRSQYLEMSARSVKKPSCSSPG